MKNPVLKVNKFDSNDVIATSGAILSKWVLANSSPGGAALTFTAPDGTVYDSTSNYFWECVSVFVKSDGTMVDGLAFYGDNDMNNFGINDSSYDGEYILTEGNTTGDSTYDYYDYTFSKQ